MCTLNTTTIELVNGIETFQQTMVAVLTMLDNGAPVSEVKPTLERLTLSLEEIATYLLVSDLIAKNGEIIEVPKPTMPRSFF